MVVVVSRASVKRDSTERVNVMSAPPRPVVVVAAFAAILGLALAVVTRTMTAAPDRPEQWKKVRDAESKGLPQTAIKELDPIIESTLAEKAYPEAIKAIAKKIALEGTIQGNKPEERITRMKAEIAKAPKEMVPVMDAILAQWYWHYFQQNRWRFVQRSATSAAPGEDFTTWDLTRLFAEIDGQFTKALAAEKELKATPIAKYDGLLDKGTLPDSYRPTLFDFVAFEAMSFYASPEQAGAKAEDAYELEAASPALSPADDFLKWKPESTDTTSRTIKALRLMQNVLAFHQGDKDQTAYLDADLFRLQYAYNTALGQDKANRYKSSLLAFAGTHGGHELSATALVRLAGVQLSEGDAVKAKETAEKAFQTYPNSHGGKLAFNLIRQIEAKNVALQTERVWADPLPVIRVTYKNFTKLHFRIVKTDWVARLGGGRYRPEQMTDADRQQMLKQDPVLEFAADLPATPDFQDHTFDVPAPKGLKPGFYFIFASPDPAFNKQEVPTTVADIWVSDLALITRGEWGTATIDGFVLKGTTGEPVVGAKVKTWYRDNRNNAITPGPTVDTDKNGAFAFQGNQNTSWLLLASHEGHDIASANDQYVSIGNNRPQPYGQTIFFTDRSLYRPGQTIQFKGICLKAEPEQDNYQTLPNKAVTVVFRDVSGQEITKLALQTNDYGSFAGSVTAPRDRIAGRMSLSVQEGVPGQTLVTVEEYKRPKFKVEVEAPKEPAKLDGEVKLTGKAMSYTGAAIGGAKVRYRVTREVRYPAWCYEYFYWRMPPNRGAAQEIAHGTSTSEADGSFPIAFVAKADRTIPEKDEPIFHFKVTADVTDTTGETRSASNTINVAYTALQASIGVESWLIAGQEVKIKVNTNTHDGIGQVAKGTVKVYRLKQPKTAIRPDLLGGQINRRGGKPVVPKPDPANPAMWEQDDVVSTLPFATDDKGAAELKVHLDGGVYRAVLETADKFGKTVTAKAQITLIDPAAKSYAVKVPNALTAPKWTLEPGQEFMAVWGTGYDTGKAFVEVEHRHKILQAYWTESGKTQATIKQAVTEAMRGGFTVRVSYVRENRAYLETRHVDVPWTNKELHVKWERFVSKLEPGKKEKWTAIITGPDAKKAVAEMVAALYDESLDAYLPHDWAKKFGVFRQDHSNRHAQFDNFAKGFNGIYGWWRVDQKPIEHLTYRALPAEITVNLWGYMYGGRGGFGDGKNMAMAGAAPGGPPMEAQAQHQSFENRNSLRAMKSAPSDKAGDPGEGGGGADQGPDLSKVAARTNLNETAFFYPNLVSDQDGVVRLEFTMPEALTKWKFLGFAHDKNLRSGFLGGETVTAKDLMVEPNPPRFLREGDVIEFSVKVTNMTDARQDGKVRLTLSDTRTTNPLDAALSNTTPEQTFTIGGKESKSFFWKLTVPDGVGPITYKAVGASDKFSDGEEGVLPVLSKRILVTESLPLPIRGNQTKAFDFKKLLDSGKSDTLKNQSFTVQMASNPSWYAVMALPYLMEFPHECSEQTFNRLYANALARHIAASDPKIRKVFDQWKNTPALDSPLEKNQDLKSVLLEETPWVRDAKSESQARRNVGILFDDNRLNSETAALLRKLSDMQHADGAWPWFPGGRGNEYITLYITTGFGRLRHLGVKIDAAPGIKAAHYLDAWADKVYRDILKWSKDPNANHLSTTIALYLYGRSFFLEDKPVAKEHQEAVNYWLGQSKKYWLQLANRQSQAHLALALKRFGDKETPMGIMASIKERSVSNEEMGMFWRDTENSWWWYHAPIETQAMMIEAFSEVEDDPKAVEDCKVWLLKQKQTQNWKTTKATADAVYGLLQRGENLLKSDALVEVKLGGVPIKPEKVEAGTGFYEEKFLRTEVKPTMGNIQVTKTDAGVAWGSVHWQYLEDVSKITAHEGTPLKLEKKLFKKTYTKTGPVLEAVNGALGVGDELVVRIVLRTDRDMEYVHLKDHRGSGTEPVNVLSSYKFQDGLMYYESTKDTASHFFIDYLPKGTYVFEYNIRVQHKGKYPTGLADIQCMYAPEFNSHSENINLEVK